MTSLRILKIQCSQCQQVFQTIWHASINTWLSPELIPELLVPNYSAQCPSCKQQININATILVNCPKGMFNLSTGDPLDVRTNQLCQWGVIDEHGNVLNANLSMLAGPPPTEEQGEQGIKSKPLHLAGMISDLYSILRGEVAKGEPFDNNDRDRFDLIKERFAKFKGRIDLEPPILDKWRKIKQWLEDPKDGASQMKEVDAKSSDTKSNLPPPSPPTPAPKRFRKVIYSH